MLSSCSSYVVSVDLIFSNCKLVWDCLDFGINVNGALEFSNQEMVACLAWMLDLFKIVWFSSNANGALGSADNFFEANIARPFCPVVLVMEVDLIFSNDFKDHPNSACKL